MVIMKDPDGVTICMHCIRTEMHCLYVCPLEYTYTICMNIEVHMYTIYVDFGARKWLISASVHVCTETQTIPFCDMQECAHGRGCRDIQYSTTSCIYTILYMYVVIGFFVGAD